MVYKTKKSTLLRLIQVGVLLWCAACISVATAATIVLDNLDGANEGFNDNSPPFPDQPNNPGTTLGGQRLAVFQAAADFWRTRLNSDVVIRISINMDPLPCTAASATLGTAGAIDSFMGFPGAPRANTFYPVALANSLTGEDLTPDTGAINNDISAIFNVDIDNNPNCLPNNWWLGINSPPPPNTVSLFDSVVHEIAHGLGFSTLINTATGAKPAGLDDAFSIHLFDEETNQFWSEMTDAERVISATNNGNVVWRGDNADTNSDHLNAISRTNGHIRMFAPNPLQPGSSISHWDPILAPDELMEPILTVGSDSRSTLQLLRDVGWDIITEAVPSSPGEINFISGSFSVFEDQGPANILVARSGGSEGAVSARIVSDGITAEGRGIDFGGINQTVNWADGETGIRIISVRIVNDEEDEPDETVLFSIRPPTGGATTSQDSTILTIQDPLNEDEPDILDLIIPMLIAILGNLTDDDDSANTTLDATQDGQIESGETQ